MLVSMVLPLSIVSSFGRFIDFIGVKLENHFNSIRSLGITGVGLDSCCSFVDLPVSSLNNADCNSFDHDSFCIHQSRS